MPTIFLYELNFRQIKVPYNREIHISYKDVDLRRNVFIQHVYTQDVCVETLTSFPQTHFGKNRRARCG